MKYITSYLEYFTKKCFLILAIVSYKNVVVVNSLYGTVPPVVPIVDSSNTEYLEEAPF